MPVSTAATPGITALQIDYDATTSERGFYAGVLHSLRVANVSLDETNGSSIDLVLHIFPLAGGQVIEYNDLIAAGQGVDQVAANEAGATCDKNPFSLKRLHC